MSDFTAFKLPSPRAIFFIDFRSFIHPSNQPSIHLSTYISFFSSLVRRQIEKFRNINSLRGQTRITRLPSKPGRWIPVLLELLKLSWERNFSSYKLLHIDATYAEKSRC